MAPPLNVMLREVPSVAFMSSLHIILTWHVQLTFRRFPNLLEQLTYCPSELAIRWTGGQSSILKLLMSSSKKSEIDIKYDYNPILDLF